ncbi:MAG: hypothetical protein ACO3JL_09950 [Myxococcota bacterium]
MNETMKDKLTAERKLTSEEADRVLAKAAELMSTAESQGHLSHEALKEGAAEVGIAPRYVEQAIAQLQAEDRLRRIQGGRRRRLVLVAITICATTVIAGTILTRASLQEKRAEVRKRELQLQNVIERRDVLLPQLEDLREKGAASDSALLLRLMDEHAGAANRVTTEQRRYQEAVVDYETTAGSPPQSWFRRLTGMPEKVSAHAPGP